VCGIAGVIPSGLVPQQELVTWLRAMGRLIAHRGPDAEGSFVSEGGDCGFTHRRLSVIDLSQSANQPFTSETGNTIVYNGEIYNYKEIRDFIGGGFATTSDTEVVLRAYEKWGVDCLAHFRGMFAFAIWDERNKKLFCARDRFGIKPFYFSQPNGNFMFASEIKALVPFLPAIETDMEALSEYFTFQYTIGEATLFKGVQQLLPAHYLTLEHGHLKVARYWDINYDVDYATSADQFEEQLQSLLVDSVRMHMRSDVPVGAYVSGGVDSSLINLLSLSSSSASGLAFHGTFPGYERYDESSYARMAVAAAEQLLIAEIRAEDFVTQIDRVIYHLDFPVGGPGSFPQFMVSRMAADHVKVVLGGQGGDEVFGGYARYVIAYLEQCLAAAINDTYREGNYVVTLESIIPNLKLLKEYRPLIRQFWGDGLFGPLDERYFRLINRSVDMGGVINWDVLDVERVFNSYLGIFNNSKNVRHEAYFDKMTHFDFKTLLPALLQVEDRMSMAHGLESRVPILDHPLIEFMATVPADVKFKGGDTKHLLKKAFAGVLPTEIRQRRDKMGFPVPLKEWFSGPLNGYIRDTLGSRRAMERSYLNAHESSASLAKEDQFSRKTWALLSLELWQQNFHDQHSTFTSLIR
jgi:asparagine synthase (glutamine-hydrolysing)